MDQIDNRELLDAINELSHEVKVVSSEVTGLSQSLTIKEILYRRTRRLTLASFIIAIISLISGAGALYAVSETNSYAKVSCLNDNKERQAYSLPWLFLVAAARADKQTEDEKSLTEDFERWVGILYSPHDCDNLSKKYDIPDPPTLPYIK